MVENGFGVPYSLQIVTQFIPAIGQFRFVLTRYTMRNILPTMEPKSPSKHLDEIHWTRRIYHKQYFGVIGGLSGGKTTINQQVWTILSDSGTTTFWWCPLQYATFQEKTTRLNHDDSVTSLAYISRLFKAMTSCVLLSIQSYTTVKLIS